MKPKPDLEALEEHIVRHNLNRADFPVLNDRPSLWVELKWIWEGFHALSASRQRGYMGAQPIAMADIISYLSFLDLQDEEDQEDFLRYVQFLDGLFMEKVDAKVAAASKKK